jgi:hypothetical protein
MRVVDIYPRDFYVTVELSLKEVGKILKALEKAQLNFDSKNREEIEAVEYVKGTLFRTLDQLYEENKKYVT